MTDDECEVFDLLLRGYNPSDRCELKVFLSRISAPLSEVLMAMLERQLIQRVEDKRKAHLSVNPAAAWFLTPPEERGQKSAD